MVFTCELDIEPKHYPDGYTLEQMLIEDCKNYKEEPYLLTEGGLDFDVEVQIESEGVIAKL